jgi:hypothetical protein
MSTHNGGAPLFESAEEQRAVLSALRVYRNRLRMAVRANLRRQWTPKPGRMDLNVAKLRIVNALLARWYMPEAARDAPSVDREDA